MMRITGRAFLVLSFIAGCLLFAGGPTTAREVSVSNIIVAQSSSTGTTKKWTTKKGREACSIVCTDGTTASQTCDTPDKPTCDCRCRGGSAGNASCDCR
jgi:hypothetical protein